MKIVLISDTHNKHKELSIVPCDVLAHAGDFTSMGYEHEIKNFYKWFSKQPAKYKISIAGNHDRLFEGNSLLAKSLVPENVIYLEDSGVEILGKYFYGTPVQLPFCNWAFNRKEEKLEQHWKAIPTDTDILITHSPPYGIMDVSSYSGEHTGSASLYKEVNDRIKPMLHVFGHNHSKYGIAKIGGTTYINASNLDDNYICINKPIIIEL